MRKIKKVIIISIAIVLSFGGLSVQAKEYQQEDIYVFNSFSGEISDEITTECKFTENNVEIIRDEKIYNFELSPVSLKYNKQNDIQGAYYYSGRSGTLCCNVMTYGDSVCLQISDMSQSSYQKAKDMSRNFTLIYSKNKLEKPDIVTSEIKKASSKNTESILRAAGRELHVYASGFSVPFLISSGSAEGWCRLLPSGGSLYTVDNLRYVIAYNWPSDGVSLWYDYKQSREAYHTPAWPSSALTTVQGSWNIDASTGAFEASATYSALAGKVPLLNTIYDVKYLY